VDYVSALHELVPSPTTLCADMTSRPDNAFVYGQLVDMSQHDSYFPPDVVRPQICNMLPAAAPKSAVVVLWAYDQVDGASGWRPSPRSHPDERLFCPGRGKQGSQPLHLSLEQ